VAFTQLRLELSRKTSDHNTHRTARIRPRHTHGMNTIRVAEIK
jgi:hypothetical protein